jgi:hypothetical protein
LAISRKNLLEWTTAAQAQRASSRAGAVAYWRAGMAAPLFAVVVALVLYARNIDALFHVGPFLVLWMISPHLAYLWSKKPSPA